MAVTMSNCQAKVNVDLTKLFRKIIVDEGRVGMIDLPAKRIKAIERFIRERFARVKDPEKTIKVLEGFIMTRIRYWAFREGYVEERVSLWDVEKAKKCLLNVVARRRPAVEALEQQFKNLLAEVKG